MSLFENILCASRFYQYLSIWYRQIMVQFGGVKYRSFGALIRILVGNNFTKKNYTNGRNCKYFVLSCFSKVIQILSAYWLDFWKYRVVWFAAKDNLWVCIFISLSQNLINDGCRRKSLSNIEICSLIVQISKQELFQWDSVVSPTPLNKTR